MAIHYQLNEHLLMANQLITIDVARLHKGNPGKPLHFKRILHTGKMALTIN